MDESVNMTVKLNRPKTVTRPMTIASLAQAVGVSRQRIYLMVKHGLIKSVQMVGGIVVEPSEANRVISSATVITSTTGDRVLFDFDRI